MGNTTDVQAFDNLVAENVPLAPFTTLGIGGSARFFAEITETDELKMGVNWALERNLPLFVLAGGSNIVVSDSGFAGLVLRISIRGVEATLSEDEVSLTAGAGEEWDALVRMTVEKGWAGFECLSGIPGRVGATPIQNVGAYGQEISETFLSLEALDRETGAVKRMGPVDCEFGYRVSRFKGRDRGRFIITRVSYRLRPNGKPVVRYPELQRRLSDEGILEPTLEDVRRAVLAIRRRKAMVIDARDRDSRSAGSFFMNPVVPVAKFRDIREGFLGTSGDQSMPGFPVDGDRVKLSAAWLIEHAGFERGYIRGNVGLSSKHVLAIVNRGGGTASEILGLAMEIQTRVRDAFGLELAPEPVFVGFDPE